MLGSAGIDPVNGNRNFLTESTDDEKQAQKIQRRLVAQVEEQRAARTKATMSTAIDAWLKVHEVEATALRGYEVNARRYVKPALGDVPIGKISMQLLEEFYAQLRVCKLRCNGQSMIDHRIDGEHECRTVRAGVDRSPNCGLSANRHRIAISRCV